MGSLEKSEINKLLSFGYFENDLPKPSPKQIRIFLSSTFKDFKLERAHLMENVYGELRKSCLTYFQKDLYFTDLRWGITEEASRRHLSSKICLDEIRKCYEQSMGPSFIALLGQRYGTRKLPSSFKEGHYNLIRQKGLGELSDDFERCYELDENCVREKHYKLKNLDLILNNLQGDKNKLKKLENAVFKNFESLRSDLSLNDFIDIENLYLTSITHQEIKFGILDNGDAKNKSCAIFRTITNMPDNSAVDSKSDLKIMNIYRESDSTKQKYLKEQKSSIKIKLEDSNKTYHEVDWIKSNKFQETNDHVKTYLEGFGKMFKDLIIKFASQNEVLNKNSVDSEILHHSLLCNKLSNHDVYREDTIAIVKEYLDNDSNNTPLIIYGPSGSGKSTLIAQAARKLRDKDDIVLIRFMGTSEKSSNIRSIILSLINQLHSIIQTKSPINDVENIQLNEFQKILLTALFTATNLKPKQKVIIYLDAIDQLPKLDHNLEWMIPELPKNVKIVYSVVSNDTDKAILQRIKLKVPFRKKCYVEIKEMDFDESFKMVTNLLNKSDRKLNDTQEEIIKSCLQCATYICPLYCTLLYDISSKWTSSFVPSEKEKKCTNTLKTIEYIFTELETLYGTILVSRCVFYLTLLEYNGISENELEDILSIDDDVLDEVFSERHPSIRRFPNSLWLLIKYELQNYITYKEMDGVTVVSWLHKAFIEASKEHYKNIFEASADKDKILMNVIDYFTEKWNEKKSNGQSGQMKTYKKKNDKNVYETFRNTKSQQLIIKQTKDEKEHFTFNRRKLNELLKIIRMLHDKTKTIDLLKRFIYFNFEFMDAKAKLKEMQFVIDSHQYINSLISQLPNSNANNKEYKELIDISTIYCNQYQMINGQPSFLIDTVVSRIESRSEFVKEFTSYNGLLLTKPYIANESFKTVFLDENYCIKKFYSDYNRRYIFIEAVSFAKWFYDKNNIEKIKLGTKEESRTSLFFIDIKDSRTIGSGKFNYLANHLKMLLIDNVNEKVNRISDLNGVIYFTSNENKLYSTDFEFQNNNLLKKFDKNIVDIVLLKKGRLLIICDDELIFYKENSNSHLTIDLGTTVLFHESTVPNQIVFSSDELNKAQFIFVVIALSRNVLQVYKFNTKIDEFVVNCVIETTFTTFLRNVSFEERNEASFEFWKSLIINESFLISHTNGDEFKQRQLEFAVLDKDVVKIIKVDNSGTHKITQEITNVDLQIGVFKNKEIRLEGFINNNIIIKMNVKENVWLIFIYDIDKKICFEQTFELTTRVFLMNHGTLVMQHFRDISFYAINDILTEEKIVYLAKIDTGVICQNNNAADFMRNGDKILRKMGNYLKCDSLVEYNLSSLPEEMVTNNCSVSSICCVIDEDILLVKVKRSDFNFEIAVLRVSDQDKLAKLEISENQNCIDVDYACKDYLIVTQKSKNLMSIYKILSDFANGQFSFRLIDEITLKPNRNFDKMVLKNNDYTFVIGFHYKNENLIEVKYIIINEKFTQPSQPTFKIPLKGYTVSKYFITSSNNYLVTLCDDKKTLIYFNTKSRCLIQKVPFEYELSQIYCLNSKDDLIVKMNKSFVYLEMIESTKTLNQHEMKHKNDIDIKLEKDNLIVIIKDKDYIKIYRLNNLDTSEKFKNKIRINECIEYVNRCCISTDGKKFISINKFKQLCVFDLNCKNKQACLQLRPFTDVEYSNLTSSQKFISFLHEDKLLTYEIL